MLCQIPCLPQLGDLSSQAVALHARERDAGACVCANLLANNAQTAFKAALLWPCRVVLSECCRHSTFLLFLLLLFLPPSVCRWFSSPRRRRSSSCPEFAWIVQSGWLATHLDCEIKPRFIVVLFFFFFFHQVPQPPLSCSCSLVIPR